MTTPVNMQRFFFDSLNDKMLNEFLYRIDTQKFDNDIYDSFKINDISNIIVKTSIHKKNNILDIYINYYINKIKYIRKQKINYMVKIMHGTIHLLGDMYRDSVGPIHFTNNTHKNIYGHTQRRVVVGLRKTPKRRKRIIWRRTERKGSLNLKLSNPYFNKIVDATISVCDEYFNPDSSSYLDINISSNGKYHPYLLYIIEKRKPLSIKISQTNFTLKKNNINTFNE